MLVKKLKSHANGHTEIEFSSGENLLKMGTFCVQVPGKIHSLKPTESLEIPNEFVAKELKLDPEVDPVEWYLKKKIELGDVASQFGHPDNIFDPFMDAVGKFCDYNREMEMRKWQEGSFSP